MKLVLGHDGEWDGDSLCPLVACGLVGRQRQTDTWEDYKYIWHVPQEKQKKSPRCIKIEMDTFLGRAVRNSPSEPLGKLSLERWGRASRGSPRLRADAQCGRRLCDGKEHMTRSGTRNGNLVEGVSEERRGWHVEAGLGENRHLRGSGRRLLESLGEHIGGCWWAGRKVG